MGQPNKSIDCATAPTAVKNAINNSFYGKLVPQAITILIIEYRGINPFYWSMVGDDVEISNNNLTIRQIKPSRSAIGNKFFYPNTGKYFWRIKVNNISEYGCKYIGVIQNYKLKKDNLNANLQSGCMGRRITWDGSCQSIYYDINGYKSYSINTSYKTGDVVGVYLDTDKKKVYFSKNNVKIKTIVSYKGDFTFQAVVGFGDESNTEKYTIQTCSWW